MKDWHLWTIIPAIFFLTLIYYGLGVNSFWNYTIKDLIYGNIIVSLGIGCVYIGDNIFKRFKK